MKAKSPSKIQEKMTLTKSNFHSVDLNHSLSNSYLTSSYIILKDGSTITLDESIPSQDINKLLSNNNKENNNNNNKIILNNLNNNKTINITKSYKINNINGKTLEMNDSYLLSQNKFNKEILNKQNNNNNKDIYYSENTYDNNTKNIF